MLLKADELELAALAALAELEEAILRGLDRSTEKLRGSRRRGVVWRERDAARCKGDSEAEERAEDRPVKASDEANKDTMDDRIDERKYGWTITRLDLEA